MRFRATAPVMGPARVSSSKRWPISISGEMPPIVVKESSPLSSMFVIAMPISSMCPTIASVGAPSAARTRAKDVPRVSEVTSANADAASRQMRDGSSSCPDGPGAVSSALSSSGAGTGCELKQARLPCEQMSFPTPSIWAWRHERGGSLRA